MTYRTHPARMLIIGTVAAGTLSLGLAGAAGAAAPVPTTPAAVLTTASTGTRALATFNCANATKALTRIEKIEARITAGLPKLTAAEAKASAASHTRRADRLKKRIARLESTTFKNRLEARASAIEDRCNVSAPSAPSGSSTTGFSTPVTS